MKNEDKVQHMRKMVQVQEEHDEEEQEQTRWSWRKLLYTVFGKDKKSDDKGTADSPDSYNLCDRKPDFRNNYGQSTALDGEEYHPLRGVGVGVYHVSLTAVCKQNLQHSFSVKFHVNSHSLYEKIPNTLTQPKFLRE